MKRNFLRLLGVMMLVVLLFSTPAGADTADYDLRDRVFPGVAPPMQLQANSAMVVDLVTGDILFEENADERMGPASLVKIATLALAFEALSEGTVSLEDQVPISERAWAANVPGSKMFIEVGDEIPLDLLVQGVAVASGNDASIAVAEYIGGNEDAFVNAMNRLGDRLGMDNTQFRNSHGLPAEGQYTTARDMAKLARYFSLRFPEAERYTSQKEFVYGVETPHEHWNGLLFTDERVVGLKTGYTSESGFHLAATARDGDRHYLAIVMGIGKENTMDYPEGTATRENEAGGLLDWAFDTFVLATLDLSDTLPGEVRVFGGNPQYVPLKASKVQNLTLPKGAEEEIAYAVDIDSPLRAPLSMDDPVGTVEAHLEIGGDPDARYHLGEWHVYPERAVPYGGLWRRFIDWLILLFSD